MRKTIFLLMASAICYSQGFNIVYNPKKFDAKEKLGQFLFYDKILSGNKNISCATCHHALAATGDGLSLSVGEGGSGLGITRNTGEGADKIHERVPRNAPHVFNIGAEEYIRMFADGRVEIDPYSPQGFKTPAGNDLPPGLDNLVAVQAMFPVTSGTEMAGQEGENPQADFAAQGNLPALWDHIAGKLQAIPEYVDLFKEAFDDVQFASDITYVHAANAIAAYEIKIGTTTNAPYDEYLAGRPNALSHNQKRGLKIFEGKGQCANCHSGTFLTDHEFHALAVPQIGPGKGDGMYGQEDYGRERVTGNPDDRYKFKTPTLRNIAITAPYGHNGAYDSLEAMIRHHLNPRMAAYFYLKEQAQLPSREDLDEIDFRITRNTSLIEDMLDQVEINTIHLTDREIDQLIDFLGALTDPKVLDMRNDVPKRVPSGLSLFD